MKVLVTGATGFIGGYVIGELLKQNHKVIATSTNKSKAFEKQWFDKVTYIEFSLDDVSSRENLFQYFRNPELIIHLAWGGLPDYKNFSHIDKNLFQQLALIKNLVSNGLTDMLITGTCLEYGMQSGSLREDILTLPGNPYAIAKDSLRKFLEALQRDFYFNFKWVRLFYMYGKGQNPKSIVPLLDHALAKGDTTFKMSGGEQLRDYLRVSEVADILIKIALQNKVQGIINCCSGKPVSVRKFVEQYLLDNNAEIKLELGYYPYPDYEPMAFWGDNEKLKKII